MTFDAAKVYREEARELLEDMEHTLLELETDPADQNHIARVFRAIHTIKGSGSMFGFDELARFSHDVETVFDKVRAGEIALDRELLSLTLEAKDHIHALLAVTTPGEAEKARSDELIGLFRSYLESRGLAGTAGTGGTGPTAGAAGTDFPEPGAYDPSRAKTWLIRYRPAPNTFLTGTDPMGLIAEMADLGSLHPVFRAGGIPSLEQLDPQMAHGWWDFLLITDRGIDAIRDVFIFVEDENGLEYGEIHAEPIRGADIEALMELIEAGAELRHQELRSRLSNWIADKVNQRATAKAGAAAPAGPPATEAPAASSIRVDSQRLDDLVNLVGELVTVQARLTQAVGSMGDGPLRSIAEDLQRLSTEMRDQALGIRMVPIGSTFGTLRRLVRDLCESMGKKAEFVGLGSQTELDKNVIDQLKDPLVHILRNSVDHGLESPEVRLAAGKPEKGNVTLDAVHSGGQIVITISDDGAGIDPAKIRQKAIEKGLIAQTDELADKELLNLVFAPGFSTAQKVSSVSGRGVGMDVVKKNIENLRGSVTISSVVGQGTTQIIRLPLTLAIIDGLHVMVGPECYVLPLTALEACQERFLDEEPPVVGSMEHRGTLIPCLSLRKLLGVPGDQPNYERIIVARVDNDLVGLAVDVVVGQQQAVIKPLSDMIEGVRFVAGTTVTGDGDISVILDVTNLVGFALEGWRGKGAAA
jgi:two-component system chemotaxis sensor kinase CheA